MIITSDKKEFLDKCRTVLDNMGIKTDLVILGEELVGKVYEDTLIYIGMSEDNEYVEIVRKTNFNPVVYMKDGDIIRFGSDFIYITEHINTLIEKILT